MMGLSASSLLTIPSKDLEKDVKLLETLFPSKFLVERTAASCVLVDSYSGAYIILRKEEYPSTLTWLVTETTIASFDEEEEVRKIRAADGTFMASIKFPGGSTVLLVPTSLVESEQGRKSICACMDGETSSLAENGNGRVVEEVLDEVELNGKRLASPRVEGLPNFPTLQVSLQQDKQLVPNMPINAKEAIEFETEIFKGKILLLIRPDNLEDDPYWKELFSKKKRKFILQVQGKFKRKPTGQVFVGAEITDRMKMGLFTRGILGILVKCLSQFFADFSYSFGSKDETEYPRVAAPAHRAFERLVVTPPGDIPPPIGGDPFDESDDDRSNRIKSSTWDWDAESTYSFSFYSMYIDLPTWHVVNLKVSGNIDLSTLWNDSALRIVLYEHSGGKHHYKADNKYAMVVQIRHQKPVESEEDVDDDLILTAESAEFYSNEMSESGYDFRKLAKQGSDFPALMPIEAFDEEFFDAEEHTAEVDIDGESFIPTLALDLLTNIDITVPAWIDLANPQKGEYQRHYALNLNDSLVFYRSSVCEKALRESGVAADTDRLVSDTFSPRMSAEEKFRRVLAISILKESKSVLRYLGKERSQTGDVLLLRDASELADFSKRIRESCYVLRAVSDRHFIEEFAVISNQSISFLCPGKKNASFRISLYNIYRVFTAETPALRDFYQLCIETAGRTIHLLFRDSNDCFQWLDTLEPLATKKQEVEENGHSESSEGYSFLEDIDNPVEEYMLKSTMWNCKNRRLLNCGNFVFKTSKGVDPLLQVEQTLRLAMDPWLSTDIEKRRLFLNSAAQLKNAFYMNLSEEGQIVFFLNLYHIMIAHAFLILGPPGSSMKWISFFNHSAYQVGDDIFSLSELEHNIIRAKMSSPSQFLSRFVIPKSHYRFCVQSTDFRLNFAMNCGSKSNSKNILVYQLGRLDQQLDEATRLALKNAKIVQKNSKEIILNLPRLCQWYSNDFGSTGHMLRELSPYLEDREKLVNHWVEEKQRFSMSNITIKYDDFLFQCRNLELKNN